MRRKTPTPNLTLIPKASALIQKGVTLPLKASARALTGPLSNFQHLYNVWLQSLSVNTRRAYAGDLKALVAWKETSTEKELMELLSEMTAAEGNMMALEWQNNLVARKLAPSSVNRTISALKSFLKLLRMNGLVSWSIEIPKRKTRAYKDTKGCGTEIVEETIKGLSAEDTAATARDEAMIRLLWGLGLRRGEIAHLDLAHVDFRAQKLAILGKGHHELEHLDLTDKIVVSLRRWLEHRGTKPGALFWNFSRSGPTKRLTAQGVWRITRRHGLGRAHGVRHASITQALEKNGGDVRATMRFSRHKDLNTLMLYDDNRRDSARKTSEALEENI